MVGNRKTSQDTIMAAARTAIRDRGAGNVSVDLVAKEAGCAKGLVHYHFKTKRGLFEAVAQDIAARRNEAWKDAFDAPSPGVVIDQTWRLLTEESAEGVTRAWTSLVGGGAGIPDQTIRDCVAQFARGLGDAASGLLRRLGTEPSVPPQEIGWLLAAVVDGMGLQLLAGADIGELEGAYAAMWLGILSLGAPTG